MLQKVPGFRSGTKWKKIVASIGYGFIILFFIGLFSPNPSAADLMKKASETMSEGDYQSAVTQYEQALDKLRSEDNKSIDEQAITDGLKQAKEAYAQQLAQNAQSEMDAGNIKEAEKLAKQSNTLIENSLAQTVLASIDESKLKTEADKYLDEALKHYENNDLEKAVEQFAKAESTLSNYDRIAEVKNTLSSALQGQADEHIKNGLAAAKVYDLSVAKAEYEKASSLVDSGYERLENLASHIADLEKIISEIGTKPENSSWDAAVAPVVEFLKQNLKDPKSVEYIDWSPVNLLPLDGKNYWAVRVKYRAKNSFGGYVVHEQIFLMQHGRVVDYADY